jgi:hypothetical protein
MNFVKKKTGMRQRRIPIYNPVFAGAGSEPWMPDHVRNNDTIYEFGPYGSGSELMWV